MLDWKHYQQSLQGRMVYSHPTGESEGRMFDRLVIMQSDLFATDRAGQFHRCIGGAAAKRSVINHNDCL